VKDPDVVVKMSEGIEFVKSLALIALTTLILILIALLISMFLGV